MEHKKNFRNQTKLFLLIFIFLTFFYYNTSSQYLLDNIKSNSKLIRKLKDVYRFFYINGVIVDQQDFMTVFGDDTVTVINDLLNDFIKECKSLKQIKFYNKTLNSYVKKYLKLTIKNYNIWKREGSNSLRYKKYYKKYQKEKDKYMQYLSTHYSTNRFIRMPESQFWKKLDKKYYIKSKDFKRYKKLNKTNLSASLSLLKNIAKHTKYFQESSIYWIELGDQYVIHQDKLGENSMIKAIKIYKSILSKKKFSIYLFEAWLKWRTIEQEENHGASVQSEIPNDEYNKLREKVAVTILNYIIKNPKDEMAINEFLQITSNNVLRRFTDYYYGNENNVFYKQLFGNQ